MFPTPVVQSPARPRAATRPETLTGGPSICNNLHVPRAHKTRGPLQETSRLLRTLGGERRLRILGALLRGELCVCELVDTLQCPQYEVSRELAALRKVGLVSDRRDGPWAYYSIPPEARADDFLGGLLGLLERRLPEDRSFRSDRACLDRRLALRVDDRCVVGL